MTTNESTIDSSPSNDGTNDPARDALEETWFAERRTSSLPPPRRSSVPPIGDAELDPWLR